MNKKSIGSYILLLELNKNVEILVGKLGKINFKKGNYAYVGSALNGLESRIKRHLRKQKKIHWHIDYLLKKANIVNVFYKENEKRYECNIVQSLNKNLNEIFGFGCSDCNCKSHLFFGSFKQIIKIVTDLKMNQYPIDGKS